MMFGYEDIDDNVILQNGGWVTSRLTDHVAYVGMSILDKDKAVVKIWWW